MVNITALAKTALTAPSRFIKPKLIAVAGNNQVDVTSYIMSMDTLEEIKNSDTLPFGGVSYNELYVTFNNLNKEFNANNAESPLKQCLNKNTEFRLYYMVEIGDNIYEEILNGVYYLDTISTDSNSSTANCTCYDKLFLKGSLPITKFGVSKNIKLIDAYRATLTAAGYTNDDMDLTACPDILLPIFWAEGTTLADVLTNISISTATNVFVGKDNRIKVTNAMSSGTIVDTLSDDTTIISTTGTPQYLNTYSDAVITYDSLLNSIASEVVTLSDVELQPGNNTISNILMQNTPVEAIIGATVKCDAEVGVVVVSATDNVVSITATNGTDEVQVATIRLYGLVVQTVGSTVNAASATAPVQNVLQLQMPIATTEAYATSYAKTILLYYSSNTPIVEVDVRANPAWELNDIVRFVSPVTLMETNMRIISMNNSYHEGYMGRIKLMEVPL